MFGTPFLPLQYELNPSHNTRDTPFMQFVQLSIPLSHITTKLSPIFLRIQIKLMRLLVGLLG